MSITELENIISYKFKEKKYLIEAITHKSTGLEYNYDKLEFLGDRVLGLVIAHKLNTLIQDQNVLNTHLKFESLTNEIYLSKVARKININKFILVQGGKDSEKFKNNDSILADVLEAIIGGIFLDGGLKNAQLFIENYFSINDKLPNTNPKSALQEMVLEHKFNLPKYILLEKGGPDHEPHFVVRVEALNLRSTGRGKTMKLAELSAAKKLLNIINKDSKNFK